MIDYEQALNAAQLEAVTARDGALLVIAGAGSGKTRTIVYRLAWLAEHGVTPQSMLLLTFTRKAAREMLHRAALLLGQGLMGVQGGTFHGFAYATLRRFPPAWLEGRSFSVMDGTDMAEAVKRCKDELKLGKGDRSFPKAQNILSILSKARNKELSVEEVLRREAFHLLPHVEALTRIGEACAVWRRQQGLLDYDDLLFELEILLRENERAACLLREGFRQIMVDEYQDTNLVQARLVRLLAGDGATTGNIMAVGDDAQSIYAFRGANVRNILGFPTAFPGARIIRLEENYRSTQPVLDVANALLEQAEESFRKRLFTRREGGEAVRLVRPMSDLSQAELVVARIRELLREHLPHEIAVLFRAGFHSYHLEMALSREGVPFRKYGGLRYAEAAHVRDVLAYARLCLNPLDMPAFERVAGLHAGIGPKTARKLYDALAKGDAAATEKAFARFPDFLKDMRFLDDLRRRRAAPEDLLTAILEHYRPCLEARYPDDWPRRSQGLEEVTRMAAAYADLGLFVADLALESPEEDEDVEGRITLSTVHSAKGLEWGAVLIIDLVEDRFPSRHAAARPEDFEEERRLMYVACTRARRHLDLYAPLTVFSRADQSNIPAMPSPFVRELPAGLYEEWVESWSGLIRREAGEAPSGGFHGDDHGPRPALRPSRRAGEPAETLEPSCPALGETGVADAAPVKLGYCRHRIFGRGKMVRFLPPDKYQVNFPGFGLKVIMAGFLQPEE